MKIRSIVIAAAVLATLGCDQKDDPGAANPKKAPAVEAAAATKVDPPKETTPQAEPDEALAACKAASDEARAHPAHRNEHLVKGCSGMIRDDSCREALGGDHVAFWNTCVESYCPQLVEAKRTSVFCEMEQEPAERAATLPARAAFLTDVMLMEREMEELEGNFHENLRKTLQLPPEQRQGEMKTLIASVLGSKSLSTRHKEIWSMGMLLAIVEPIAPPMAAASE